ncbi:hypothetical protein [Halovivax gelatinilyticus]|uniref:hypothetical protein n=1 Tax=Halovivax gelatinilyticus TaxID=2961597 RepID=UPI0020CA78DE|nr:hypothetical protein [Halovivax gelatinilyticus]
MKSLDQLLAEIDADELRRRIHLPPKPSKPSEFRCNECGCRCTRLTNGSEAGHYRDCSRRLRRTGSNRVQPVLTDGGRRGQTTAAVFGVLLLFAVFLTGALIVVMSV